MSLYRIMMVVYKIVDVMNYKINYKKLLLIFFEIIEKFMYLMSCG